MDKSNTFDNLSLVHEKELQPKKGIAEMLGSAGWNGGGGGKIRGSWN